MAEKAGDLLTLTRLEAEDLGRMADALRQGRPVDLDLATSAPRGLRLDELAPLFRRARAWDPADQRALDAFAAPSGGALGPGPGSPRVTVIIPTHRQAPQGLKALLAQDLPVRVIVVANGPGVPDELPGAEVLRVPWRGHGPTRQRALALVDDPYVFLTVDDAIPLGRSLLRRLVEALEAGPWDAVIPRQIPWPDADPVTKERLRSWTPPGHRVVAAAQADHVATLHRTATLRAHPLPDVPIAEDAWWSRKRQVGLVPMAPVLHSHARSLLALYQRNRDIHEQLVAMGRAPVVGEARELVGALPGLLRP